MFTRSRKGFTLVEIMVVTTAISILFVSLYMGSQPYMMRARDTKRITSMISYSNILEGYEKDFDTFPSNFGSGNSPANTGYCLSEIARRGNISSLGYEGMFSTLQNDTALPPTDPLNIVTYPLLCPEPRSFIYSKLGSGSGTQLMILMARLEIESSRNYGTGTDIVDFGKINNIFFAKKGESNNGGLDPLYIVSRIRQ